VSNVTEKEKICAPVKNNILVQDSKILSTISPFYGVYLSVSTLLDIFSIKKE
jgi:hypothetical protein